VKTIRKRAYYREKTFVASIGYHISLLLASIELMVVSIILQYFTGLVQKVDDIKIPYEGLCDPGDGRGVSEEVQMCIRLLCLCQNLE